MDSRAPGWAKLLLATLQDAPSTAEAEEFVAQALDAAMGVGRREGLEEGCRYGTRTMIERMYARAMASEDVVEVRAYRDLLAWLAEDAKGEAG